MFQANHKKTGLVSTEFWPEYSKLWIDLEPEHGYLSGISSGYCASKTRVALAINPNYNRLIEVIRRFLISTKNQYAITADDDAAEGTTSHSRGQPHRHGQDVDARDIRGPSRGKLTKEQKKTQRGANKGRKFGKVRDELDLCWKVANGSVCEFGEGYDAAFIYWKTP